MTISNLFYDETQSGRQSYVTKLNALQGQEYWQIIPPVLKQNPICKKAIEVAKANNEEYWAESKEVDNSGLKFLIDSAEDRKHKLLRTLYDVLDKFSEEDTSISENERKILKAHCERIMSKVSEIIEKKAKEQLELMMKQTRLTP